MTLLCRPPLMIVPSPPAPPVARTQGLRHAMRRLPGGVSVVTAGIGADRTGATVTSAQSLSMEPETMVVSIDLASSTFTAIRRHGHFCVNVLNADQRDVADRFAGISGVKGAQRYEGADWHELETGAAALRGALASIDCEVDELIERHSHALVIGAVRAVSSTEGEGLVYVDGAYGTIQALGA